MREPTWKGNGRAYGWHLSVCFVSFGLGRLRVTAERSVSGRCVRGPPPLPVFPLPWASVLLLVRLLPLPGRPVQCWANCCSLRHETSKRRKRRKKEALSGSSVSPALARPSLVPPSAPRFSLLARLVRFYSNNPPRASRGDKKAEIGSQKEPCVTWQRPARRPCTTFSLHRQRRLSCALYFVCIHNVHAIMHSR